MPSSLKEVSGRMSFDQGASAASTQFSLELTAVNGGDALRVNSMRQSDGSFRIRLPVGEWRVAVSGIPAAMNLKSAFYGDSDLLRGSLKVDPMDSQELRLIVSPRPGTNLVRLRGRVIPPPADNSLRAMYEAVQAPTIRVSGPMILESRIQPDGTFEFPQVLSGTYSWCCNFGYTYFNVPAAGIDNLTLRAIPGRVIVEGATLESPVYVQAADVAGTSAANIAPRDGSFLLILAEGSFRIGMDRVPAGFYVKSIRYGSTDLTNQILVLPRGEDAKELILTLAARP
jgi:hypothetical protein